ncbi:unnamed protein product [Calypogeia fissa]
MYVEEVSPAPGHESGSSQGSMDEEEVSPAPRDEGSSSQGSMDKEEVSPGDEISASAGRVPYRDPMLDVLNCLLGAITKEIASRASPAGAASASSQDVSDLRGKASDCKCRCQVDASSRGRRRPQRRKPKMRRRQIAYQSCFLIAWPVLTNSSELVEKMVKIATENFGPKPQKLFDVFTVDEVEMTVRDVAYIMGNESIKASLGIPVCGPHEDNSGEQSLLEKVSSVMDMEVDFRGTKTQLRQVWVRIMAISSERSSFWGRRYGITLGANGDDKFILHSMGLCSIWLNDEQKELWTVVCHALSEKGLLDRVQRVRDDAGRTPLHYSGSPLFVDLMGEYSSDSDILGVTDYQRRTPLHVAAALDQTFFMKQPNWEECEIEFLTPHHMAAMGGRESILRAFLEEKRLCDQGRYTRDPRVMMFSNSQDEDQEVRHFKCMLALLTPALHLAAASGNPLAVKAILESGEIDPHAKDGFGDTALHYAAGWEVHSNLLHRSVFVSLDHYIEAKKRNPMLEDSTPPEKSLGGIIGCIDLLIQAGLDMEQPNKAREPPRLGLSAPNELTTWWYDKLTKQSEEAKTNLAAAAQAISVTAALVATASYVGPLQPPLGLSTSAEAWLTGYSQVK